MTEAFIWRLKAIAGTYPVKFAGVTFNFLINQAFDVFLEVVNENGHAIIATVSKFLGGNEVYTTEAIQLGNGATSNWQTVGIERESVGPPRVEPFGLHRDDIVTFKIQSPG